MMRSSHGGIKVKVQTSTAVKLIISEVPRLDPITVFLEDLAPREGKATISCYNQSWSAWWGGMGDRSIKDFILSCDERYLANNFGRGTSLDSTVVDVEGIADHARKHIISLRKGNDLDADCARELYDKAERLEHLTQVETLYAGYGDVMQDIFGDEWWHTLPEKPNGDYVYLCRIINAVKAALQEAS
jgi:hypothetical protein